MQLIPAVDVLDGQAVRLERGDYDAVTFRHDLADFFSRVVATGPALIHVVDLDGARRGRSDPALLAHCVALAGSTPLQVSGGLRSLAAAQGALDQGAARVIMGSAAWDRPTSLGELVGSLGDRLVVALDVREGRIAVRGWTATEHVTFAEALHRCVEAGARRVHVTAIERDGTMSGPDLLLYEEACASGLAVVAAGGVRDDRDVARLADVGCEAAVMGLGYLRRIGLRLPDDPQRHDLGELADFGDIRTW
ncbi:MAG: HisA/HisF-related TIM barrel protein [Acidimicrobiales bacterium]